MSSQDNLKIYSSNGHLVFEDFIVREKIRFDAIEDILIYHVGETYNNQINFYLSQPIVYENINGSWWSKLLYKLFLKTHSDRLTIEEGYSDENISVILSVLQENLTGVSAENDLQNSIFWKTVDQGYEVPRAKVVYSKNGSGLVDVLKKYGKMIDKKDIKNNH